MIVGTVVRSATVLLVAYNALSVRETEAISPPLQVPPCRGRSCFEHIKPISRNNEENTAPKTSNVNKKMALGKPHARPHKASHHWATSQLLD